MALALGGCSMVQLGYDHLDTLAQWKIADYVSFNDAQQRQFDQSFDALWAWHRKTQLPRYADLLREIAAGVGGPPPAARIDGWLTRAEELGKTVAQRADAPTAALLATLSDAQVQHLIEQIARDRRHRAEKWARRSAEQRRDQQERKMRDRLEDWIGDLDAAQRQRLHQWAQQRKPTTELGLAVYQAWNARLASVLKTRRQDGFQQRFDALFTDDVNPDQTRLDALNQSNRANWVALVSDLGASLSEAQRAHLQHRLRDTADQLQQLADET